VNCIIDNRVILWRAPEGPLAAHVESFANWAIKQGYSLSSVRRKVCLVRCFSRWLKQHGIRLRKISFAYASRYLRYRARRVRCYSDDATALRQLIDYLRSEGLLFSERIPTPKLTPAECCLQAYGQYLRDVRALAEATVVNYAPTVRDFLKDRFGNGPVTLSRLRACDIVRFLRRQTPRLSLTRAKVMINAMRSFLQYARIHGEVTLDLAAAVPAVAKWSMPSIPRAITPVQVRRVLASIDPRTAIGCRDYAILLLLARLGLRSGEVVSLELDDLDWNAGQLRVRGKCGQRSGLPLTPDVGKAIAAYLRRGRPDSTSRRVFLCTTAPIRGLSGPTSICAIVQNALCRAGVDAPTFGAHQFRHGLATEMLRHGASLAEIGDVLGHRQLQTTTIYAKVDIKSLRSLALPWPRGAR